MRLAGKVAVVTGAARGIGLACAEALAKSGAAVVITDLDAAAAAASAAAVSGRGYASSAEMLDVTDPPRWNGCRVVFARHGRVDILVNNAGIARSERRRRRWPTSIG